MPLILERILTWLGPYLAKALIAEILGNSETRDRLKEVMLKHDKAETDQELSDAAKAWQDSIRS
jgi:hypothetical protein